MKKPITIISFLIIFLFFASNKALASQKDTYLSKEIQAYCIEVGGIYCVAPELLMSMTEAESGGNPKAENGGCKGLMQVSDRWHKDRMKRLGVTDIFDTRGNILIATDYLYELFEKYEDVGMVLMTYNGDSDAENYMNGKAGLSVYAEKILERSAELEELHGK